MPDQPESATFDDLTLTDAGRGVTVLTLQRPRQLNALRWQTYEEIKRAVEQVDGRALVITGAGRGFCAGDDVHDVLGDGTTPVGMDDGLGLDPTTRALLESRVPTIAAVNGVAAGWGLDLALLCDLRVASTAARFLPLYVSRGQCPDVASLVRLAQLVGRERALEMLLTDRSVDADTAHRWGLVTNVVPADDVVDVAVELAATIASRPPLAVAAVREGFRRAGDPGWDALGAWAADTHAALFRTNDHQEAVRAFLERRPGVYTGT